MLKRYGHVLLALLAAVVLAACATRATTLDAQWVNPKLVGKQYVQSIMVVGAVRDPTNRRLFEDRMVAQLAGLGVKAAQSYQYLPEQGAVTEARLREAVAKAGVSHALVTRVINVSTNVNVTPGMVMGPAWGPGFGPWGAGWGGGWGGFGGYYNSVWATSIPPTITTTQNVHADTRLFEVKDAAVLWSAATTTSLGYDSVGDIMTQFAQLIVNTMSKDGVLN